MLASDVGRASPRLDALQVDAHVALRADRDGNARAVVRDADRGAVDAFELAAVAHAESMRRRRQAGPALEREAQQRAPREILSPAQRPSRRRKPLAIFVRHERVDGGRVRVARVGVVEADGGHVRPPSIRMTCRVT
jgi:hypothetical protein